MAGEASRLIAPVAGMLFVATGPAAPAAMQALAGRYGDTEPHAEIIPIDRRHAYVHLAHLHGLNADRICDFEGVMMAGAEGIIYHGEDAFPGRRCTLRVTHAGRTLAWSQPDGSQCRELGDCFATGGLPWSSRHPARPDMRIETDGGAPEGYSGTVKAWRGH